MANTTLSTLFTNIANAIRSKTGKTETIKAVDFPAEISNISDLDNLIIKPNTGGTRYGTLKAGEASDIVLSIDNSSLGDTPVDIKYVFCNVSVSTEQGVTQRRAYLVKVLENNVTSVDELLWGKIAGETINGAKIEPYGLGSDGFTVTISITSDTEMTIPEGGVSGVILATQKN